MDFGITIREKMMGSMERIKMNDMLGMNLVNGARARERKQVLYTFLREENAYVNLDKLDDIIKERKRNNDIF